MLSWGPLVGGPALAAVRNAIAHVGPTRRAVLVLGETGAGKDVVARLVHEASGRKGAFVAVDCALFETQPAQAIFGATGGTLFLDEIGDLPPVAQARLLRALSDGEARGTDVRVISASKRDPSARVSRGEFRADLWPRVAEVPIHLPPLRERTEDIPALVLYLLARAGHEPLLDLDALEALVRYEWPMNVRELDTVLRNAARSSRIALCDFPEHIRAPFPRGGVSRPDLERALDDYRGNVRRASRSVGISRGHFYRLLKRWELDPDAYREEPMRRLSW